jgi:hypothetical protein
MAYGIVRRLPDQPNLPDFSRRTKTLPFCRKSISREMLMCQGIMAAGWYKSGAGTYLWTFAGNGVK